MIHEDASEVATDGFVEQHSCHRRIHTTRKSQNHAVVAELRFQFCHSAINERRCTPVLMATANVYHKVAQQSATLKRVEHLGVELHPPKFFIFSLISRKFHLRSGSNATETFGDSRNSVAMAHPHLRVFVETAEERVLVFKCGEISTTIFASVGGFYLSTIDVRHILCTIANAQDGKTAANFREVHLEGFRVINTERRTRKNDTNHRRIIVRKFVVRQNFAESVHFADATPNELSGLRTEVEDNNFLLHI